LRLWLWCICRWVGRRWLLNWLRVRRRRLLNLWWVDRRRFLGGCFHRRRLFNRRQIVDGCFHRRWLWLLGGCFDDRQR
jgi:hypothetical protein